MRTAVHGMPRIGPERELKWALESFWSGRSGSDALEAAAAAVRRHNWELLSKAEIDFVPSNDFSLYDHVLDAAVAVGAIPDRFDPTDGPTGLDRYFAMARGGDLGTGPVAPLDLTKWFDTNYHHLVPELGPGTAFHADATKAAGELVESAALGVGTMPVFVGPLTLLTRSTGAVGDIGVLDRLVEAYAELVAELAHRGASWVRFDEPALVEDRSAGELDAIRHVYSRLAGARDRPAIAISTFFGHVGEAMPVLSDLPVEGVGLDFCAGETNLDLLEQAGGLGSKLLFAGVVDGRNVWVNHLDDSVDLLRRLRSLCAEVVVSTSCSLMHVPASLAAEKSIDVEIRPWLAFAEEKLVELRVLAAACEQGRETLSEPFEANRAALDSRRRSPRVIDPAVRRAVSSAPSDPRRTAGYEERARAQQASLGLPGLPTTTIGSFPQTGELRSKRALFRAGKLGHDDYQADLRKEIDRAVDLQERIGLDVLVHGEPERDDMVRYFASQLHGFVLPDQGWVQSYGSRCVRPPILFGDVSRPEPMTVEWTRYARSRTSKPVKGMLTGPVTMLRWSFVRDDLSEAEVADQLAMAVARELVDLQADGTAVIQVDEPAFREGMPLRREDQAGYLVWAARAFRLVTSAAASETQVHTHMCYAQLDDIVDALEHLDVDVVSLEAARSGMRLLGSLPSSTYRGGVGPGVYDVHSPATPDAARMEELLRRALDVVGPDRLWVNPDCGLKTRRYAEVEPALEKMVEAAQKVRKGIRR